MAPEPMELENVLNTILKDSRVLLTRARMHHKVVGNFGSEADVSKPVLPTFQIQ